MNRRTGHSASVEHRFSICAPHVVALVLALITFPASPAAAQLSAELLTDGLRLRKGGVIPLEVRMTNRTPGIIEGRLELTLLRGGSAAAIHRSGELVFQPGTRTVALPLPPLPEIEDGDGIGAQLRFLQKDGALELGEHQIGILGLGANELVLAIPHTGRRHGPMDIARERSLHLESLRPALDKAPWFSISTVKAPLEMEQLPRHALGWLAYDAVLLDGAAFAAAKEGQLAALARWVEGGGSVFVCPNDPPATGHGEHHLAFLKRICASQPARAFSIGAGGIGTSSGGAAPIECHAGMGRAVIALGTPREHDDYKRKEWRLAAAWIWNVADDHRHSIRSDGVLDADWARTESFTPVTGTGHDLEWVWDAANGFAALTPGAPRQLPLAVVAGVLGLLLLLIGPVDWLALGWVRRRRWTWVAFPCVCAGFAWWMAHLSARYLGASDRTGTVRFVDVGDDGRVLREVRYELLFPANDREWALDLRDAVAVPVPRPGVQNFGAPQGVFAVTRPQAAPAVSEWPSPGRFAFRQTIRQWTPALVRVTAFPETMDDSGLDWAAARAASRSPAVDPGSDAPEFTLGPWSGFGSTNAAIHTSRLEILEMQARFNPGGEASLDEGALMRLAIFRPLRDSLRNLRVACPPEASGGIGDLRMMTGGGRNYLVAWRREQGVLHIFRRHFSSGAP